MRRWIARAAAGVGILAALVILGLAGLIAFLGSGDPVAAARAPIPAYWSERVGVERVEKDGAVRKYEDLRLVAPGRPPVQFTVSLPEAQAGARLPVLLIVGGLRSGRENLERLPPLGPNALISIEYPYRDTIRDKRGAIPARFFAVRRAAEAMPEQLAGVLAWARAQPWADERRMSLLGYSLGAIFVPVAQEKARANAIPIETTIMAFGGADLGRIVPGVFHLETPALRALVSILAAALFHPVEPTPFLARMTGDILIINAADDELIPPASAALMTQLAPEPKWVVTIPGEHIDPRDPAMLLGVVDVTKAWLIERGAANPER